MSAFRQAIDARDMDAVEQMLADDVVFRSPVAFKPYAGKAITSAILRTVVQVFEDFHYVREIGEPDGRDHALVFEAKVDGLAVTGCDFLQFDDNGKIVDFMVMVRPLRAAEALAKEMGARFDSIVEMASRGN
ncbi:nuclear transport factor 2 family protein [Gordonia sp. HNM0687]|uniref:Nuclear transport factor 2 family protein n=1 Tax=Gordonia mangrovi TaxID=2665643 RepID=A0A6L7GLX3_9ACTN|nr:nuclear transport factor 2 family protein [Gordonia mangrovi]MDY6807648.1 nuclear transport factor 2 family protein [Actinomycetota bacterium]MXP19765.1 nuclear transport factor 2 family protein [Gordonia mangrovi]UVF79608.1 nuclear transport factor 2 family protein [Gordonia mangrovi]